MSESSTGAEPTLARVLEVLRDVIDPELGLNVVDLGLVYGAEVHANRVHVRLTMTTAACPLGEQIVEEADARLRALPGVSDVHVELVWDPPWRPERMSQAAKRALGWQS